MLYLLYGRDSFRSRKKLNEILLFFRAKISNLGVFKVEEENFNPLTLEEMLRTQMLFEKKHVVVCDKIIKNQPAQSFLAKNIKNFSLSPNIFIFLEEELDAQILELFKQHSQKIQEFKLLTGIKLKKWIEKKSPKIPLNVQEEIIKNCGSDLWRVSKEIEKYELGGKFSPRGLTSGKYNPFAICDAIAVKNKGRAWVLFQQALLAGVPAEEVFYKIVWQIKNLLLLKKLNDAKAGTLEKETKLHPYVLKKTLAATWNFSEEELKKYSFALVKIYHDARRGIEDFSLGTEKFLLNIVCCNCTLQ
jgi:DNA polymerase III delta subunit